MGSWEIKAFLMTAFGIIPFEPLFRCWIMLSEESTLPSRTFLSVPDGALVCAQRMIALTRLLLRQVAGRYLCIECILNLQRDKVTISSTEFFRVRVSVGNKTSVLDTP